MNLTTSKTEPNTGIFFAVNIHTPFDAHDFADFNNVNFYDLDQEDVKNVQNAQSRLTGDETLYIELA